MTALSAFFGREELKQALIEDIEALGLFTKLWMMGQDRKSRFEVVAAEFGLDANLVRLAGALAGTPEKGAAFLAALVRLIPVGKDTAGFAQRFYLYGWSGAPWGIEPRLRGTVVYDPALAIIGLVQDSMSTPIAAPVWRKARRALDSCGELAPEVLSVVDVLREMAWDLGEGSAPVSDFVTSWQQLCRQDSYRENGWTLELSEQANAVRTKLWRAAAEAAGSPADPDDKAGHLTKVQAEFQRLAQASEDAQLLERSNECEKAAYIKLLAWTEKAQEGLLNVVGSAMSTVDEMATA